ncbi:ABC transporter permease [Sphingobacterium hungaricum]|uniref:ABC transporter permease n=1 Tax=Sphingobacterium hungaricum TaxID=2082723 RepID=A0A928YR80_9SPHI|nr:FtsX-like permease family protein [Sphingobacterium hungaricum]MBE8715031.1 ABC transporter permease [Sphingobacterium hungaricum]
MLKNWFKIFLYNTRHNLLYFLLTVFGLGIGISAVVLSSLYWIEEHQYDQWNPYKDEIYEVVGGGGGITVQAPLGPALKDHFGDRLDYSYWENDQQLDLLFADDRRLDNENGIRVQTNFFDFFPFEIIEGSVQDFINNPNAIALEQQEASKLFKDKPAINKIIANKDTITSVVKLVYKLPKYTTLSPSSIRLGMDNVLAEKSSEWNWSTYGLLLKSDVLSKSEMLNEIEALETKNTYAIYAKDEGLTLEEYLEKNSPAKYDLNKLSTLRLEAKITGFHLGHANYKFLVVNVAVSLLILLVSIMNYINLTTAQQIKRIKEMGIRLSNGADRKSISAQFIFESFLVISCVFLIGLTISELSLPAYNDLLTKNLSLNIFSSFKLLVPLFLSVFIISGILPSIYFAKYSLLNALKGQVSSSKKNSWFRKSILTVQFAISFLFVICGYIIYQQVDYMITKDLGFSGAQVIDVKYKVASNKDKYQFYESFKNDLLKTPGVLDVNISTMNIGSGIYISTSGKYGEKDIAVSNLATDFAIDKLLDFKILEGRGLDAKITSDSVENVLVNEAFVKKANDSTILNKTFVWNGDQQFKIVGVVKDFYVSGLERKVSPILISHVKTIAWMGNFVNTIHIKISEDDMEKTISSIEEFWKSRVDKTYPFDYEFVDKKFAKTYGDFVKQRNLFATLSLVVVCIALFGLFALASFTIERRYKEISIRKVLGAEAPSLLRSLSKEYILMCIIGFLLAIIPAYYFMQDWLNNFAYRIDMPINAFVISFVTLLILTLSVVLSKAYRATKINALTYLKYE